MQDRSKLACGYLCKHKTAILRLGTQFNLEQRMHNYILTFFQILF
jgi:hypothetical protein